MYRLILSLRWMHISLCVFNFCLLEESLMRLKQPAVADKFKNLLEKGSHEKH